MTGFMRHIKRHDSNFSLNHPSWVQVVSDTPAPAVVYPGMGLPWINLDKYNIF